MWLNVRDVHSLAGEGGTRSLHAYGKRVSASMTNDKQVTWAMYPHLVIFGLGEIDREQKLAK